MAFTLRDISIILGEKINRVRPWVLYVKPSVREATSRGETNLFSRTDLYRFAILRGLVDFGWARETVGRLISSIDEDTFWRCVHAWYDEFRFSKDYFDANFDNWIDVAIKESDRHDMKAFSEFNDAAKEKILEALSNRASDRKIYLLFLIMRPLGLPDREQEIKIHCIPICENPPQYNGKPLMENLENLPEYVKRASEAHLIDVVEIMRNVSDSLYVTYPQAFKGELHVVMRNILGIDWNKHIEKQEALEK